MNNRAKYTAYGFGSGLTGLTRKMLIIYGAIYVAELILTNWMNVTLVRSLAIHPVGAGFRIWQPLTHPFIHHPGAPLNFLIMCLVFYFFSAPVQNAMGSRRFLIFFYASAAGGAVLGLLLGGVSGFSQPFMGMGPSILAMIVVFGLLNPEATILLMFVLPIKAKYISYGTVIVTAVLFLAKADPSGAYHLGGMGAGYLYFRYGYAVMDPKWLKSKYYQWKAKRLRAKFSVLNGGKDDDQDKPTYH